MNFLWEKITMAKKSRSKNDNRQATDDSNRRAEGEQYRDRSHEIAQKSNMKRQQKGMHKQDGKR